MGKTLDFEYYEEDRLCTKVHVDYKTQKIDVVNYTDDIVSQAFGRRNVTIDTIDAIGKLTALKEVIPTNTPTVLYAEEGYGPYYVCGETEAQEQTCSDGNLTGVLSAQIESNGYVLQKMEDGTVGFHKLEHPTATTKNSCFIPADRVPKEIELLLLKIQEDNTGISQMHTGQIGNSIQAFNIAGQPISNDTKGVVIINGKKELKLQ